MQRKHFAARLARRFSLRLHMSLIVLGTTSSGVALNWLLFHLGVTPLWGRIFLAVGGTYFVFLALVRLWLAMMSHWRVSPDHVPDILDLGIVNFPGGGGSPVLTGQGGSFAGGGASTSFDGGAVQASVAPEVKTGGFDLGLPDLDDEGILLFVAFLVLIGAVVLAGGYLVWEGPVILAETLFEFSLAAALMKKLKKAETSDWMGHLFKLTWKPYLAVLLVTLLFSILVLSLRPEADRLADLWKKDPTATAPMQEP